MSSQAPSLRAKATRPQQQHYVPSKSRASFFLGHEPKSADECQNNLEALASERRSKLRREKLSKRRSVIQEHFEAYKNLDSREEQEQIERLQASGRAVHAIGPHQPGINTKVKALGE
jgi:nucleosome binding factor SPN SPT16 subunit